MAGRRRGKRETSDIKGARILLVEARYYDDIADLLLAGAMKELQGAGAAVDLGDELAVGPAAIFKDADQGIVAGEPVGNLIQIITDRLSDQR